MSDICAFSTASNDYVPAAAGSLLSIRRWNDSIPLCIIGKKFSEAHKLFLEYHNIEFIEINLDYIFDTCWEYPIECYYLFAGPNIFYERGFKYSLYIDGDIYCNNDPLGRFTDVASIAGVEYDSVVEILGNDFEKIKDIWSKNNESEIIRLQSGVLYFNNEFLHRINFLEKIGDLYLRSKLNDIPRKGDDSLLALFSYVFTDIQYKKLPIQYNYITKEYVRDKKNWLIADENLYESCIFFHFTYFSKPWDSGEYYPTYIYKYFINKWRHTIIDKFSDKQLKRLFPLIKRKLVRQTPKFYWWKSKNVGDLVTPYYLQNVCKVEEPEKLNISESKINEIEKKKNNLSKSKRLLNRIFESKDMERAEYCVSTGSVVRLCGDHALVFGSGIRSRDQKTCRSFVRSVRGPLTRDKYIEDGNPCPKIFGDPALLLPRFFNGDTFPKDIKITILPHFTEYENVSELYRNSIVYVADMGCGDLEKILEMVCRSERTVSSSLHGLVFSHAYGIPTRRIFFSNYVYGDGTKYEDYYASLNILALPPIDADGFRWIDPIILYNCAMEKLENYDDSRLMDAMFFDEDGFRKSLLYPY
jgi:hypothetical protein